MTAASDKPDLTLNEPLRRRMIENLEQFDWRGKHPGDHRHAAVAATIVDADDGETASLILTRRSSKLRRHGGQWALPGGRVDPGESASEAALRELSEEVGVTLGEEAVLGRLDDYVTRSGYRITPVVVWAGKVDDFEVNPDEVAFAIRIPLPEVIADHNPRLFHIAESEKPVLSLRIDSLGHEIYAPTAAVIYQTLEVAVFGRDSRIDQYEQPVFAWG